MTPSDQVRSSTGTGSLMPAPRTPNHRRRALLVLLGAVCALLCVASAAQAAGPQLSVSVTHNPATFSRGQVDANFAVTVTNSGDAPTGGPVSTTVNLPMGLQLKTVQGGECSSVPSVRDGVPLTCNTPGALEPGDAQFIQGTLIVAFDAPSELTPAVTASAAGAPDATAEDHIPVVDRTPFGPLDFTARSLDAGGSDDTAAGGHPFQATTSFHFPSYPIPSEGINGQVEEVRNIWVELPPGFVGAASAAPRCPLPAIQDRRVNSFLPPPCPAASQVGSVVITGAAGDSRWPVFNVPPEKGYPAAFAFKYIAAVVVSYPQLRPRGGGYGLSITVPGASRFNIRGVSFTLWGTPAAPAHDSLRYALDCVFGCPVDSPTVPFLSNQSDCLDAQPTTKLYVDSWAHPARMRPDGTPDLSDPNWKSSSAPAPTITGCDAPALADQFKPSISAGPTSADAGGSTAADTPSGYHVDLEFPQANDPTDPDTVFDPSVPQAPQLEGRDGDVAGGCGGFAVGG